MNTLGCHALPLQKLGNDIFYLLASFADLFASICNYFLDHYISSSLLPTKVVYVEPR